MNNELQTINFHNESIFMAEHDGQPYVPVRPIIENIGLDWKAQHRKLANNKGRWSVVMMTTVADDGKQREMVTIPLRKTAAFLYSIDANKVRPDLKDKVLMYQEECDEVLWSYWTEGVAINDRTLPAEAMVIEKDEYINLLKDKISLLEAQRPRRNRKPMPLTDADRQEILDLYANGMSQADIAKRTKRSGATISFVVRLSTQSQ